MQWHLPGGKQDRDDHTGALHGDAQIYNGNPIEITVTSSNSAELAAPTKIIYSERSSPNFTTTDAPINVGDFTASITVGGVTAKAEFTITKAAISNVAVDLTAPAAGEVPQTTVTAGTGYTATIKWNEGVEKFGFNTAYTATVTMTADSNHKFADGLAVEGWTVSNTEGVLTLTKTFDATRKAKLTEPTNVPANKTLTACCTDVNGSTLTITKAGTIEITMTTAANGAYAAGNATATLTVKKAAGTGSVIMDDWTYGETAKAPVTTSTTGNTVDSYLYESTDGKGYSNANAPTGAYEITYTGRDNSYNSSAAPTNAGDYSVTFKIPDSDLYYSGNISINFTIAKAQATVTADDKEAYIGNRMPELTYKVSGLIGSDTVSVELSCDANMNRAGETPIVVTATDSNGNYEITTVNGTLTVKMIYIPIIPSNPTYPPVVDGGDNGDVSVIPKNPEKGDTVVITPDPDNGYEVDEIIVTDKNGTPVTVTDNGDGTYSFKQPSGKVNIEVTFKEIIKVCPGDKTCPMYGYTDLDMTAWYHDGVHYCIENGLMSGYGDGIFKPNADTTRAMITVMLWRLNGSPVVNDLLDFEDVEEGQWYTEAIRWAKSEGIAEGYGNGYFGTAGGGQFLSQQFCGGLGVAVYGSIGDQHALILRTIRGPGVVLVQIIAQIFLQYRAVERADGLNVQLGGFFQQRLNLHTIFAHDADVVAACFAGPVLVCIQRTELAETVGGEQHLVAGIISHNDFRPVYHGRTYEGQGVTPQCQRIALFHDHAAVGIVRAKKLLHHDEGFGRGYYNCIREGFHEYSDVGRVVRLHVLYDQIVWTAAVQLGTQAGHPFLAKAAVHRIHDGNFVVADHVRIIGHAVGNHVLPLKQVNVVIVDADVTDIVGNKHNNRLLSYVSICFDYTANTSVLQYGNQNKKAGAANRPGRCTDQ